MQSIQNFFNAPNEYFEVKALNSGVTHINTSIKQGEYCAALGQMLLTEITAIALSIITILTTLFRAGWEIITCNFTQVFPTLKGCMRTEGYSIATAIALPFLMWCSKEELEVQEPTQEVTQLRARIEELQGQLLVSQFAATVELPPVAPSQDLAAELENALEHNMRLSEEVARLEARLAVYNAIEHVEIAEQDAEFEAVAAVDAAASLANARERLESTIHEYNEVVTAYNQLAIAVNDAQKPIKMWDLVLAKATLANETGAEVRITPDEYNRIINAEADRRQTIAVEPEDGALRAIDDARLALEHELAHLSGTDPQKTRLLDLVTRQAVGNADVTFSRGEYRRLFSLAAH